MAPDLSAQDVASRLVVGLAGPQLNPEEETWLQRWQPAGVILFARNVIDADQLYGLCAKLHNILPGGEIVADHEGGPVSQLAEAVGRPPAAWSLGQVDDTDLTRQVHRETGRRLRQVGVDRVLAPCADVLSESRNPVIGVRAFGSSWRLVCRHVEEAVAGLRESGMSVCLKHWPGHGASTEDSHLVATNSHEVDSANGWREPFSAGLTAGADAVMVGHLSSESSQLPATLAAQLMDRWRVEFETSAQHPVRIYCDDITMGALRPAMAQLGIAEPDSLETGLVEPANLPLDWMRVLAAAGSDRLLIRGLPTGAMPVGKLLAPGTGIPAQAPNFSAGSDTSSTSYDDIWEQWAQTLDPDFIDPTQTLGWLDLTGDDRWEVVSGQGKQSRQVFQDHLARVFAQVDTLELPVAEGGPRPAGKYSRLLVTSHRPLPVQGLKIAAIREMLTVQGAILVAGHPSLAVDMVSILPSAWAVTACYDINWDKLSEIL